jgi:putative hydroxymethylpyrimidine transport system ATP-binding protein
VSPCVDVDDLRKSFGDLLVLDGVSFRIDEGEAVGILGPSGCGKTTLLRILLGLEVPDAGTVASNLERAGYLPQDVLLFPWKTVMENAELPLELQGVRRDVRRARVREELPRFGLAEFADAYPHEISGGMRQRLALLRAALTGSRALVLDEPFGALDTLTRHRLQDWLSSLLEDLDRTLLFVTHDLDEAVTLARRVLVLSRRPAHVVGETAVPLDRQERSDRLGRAAVAARDRVFSLLEEGDASDPGQPV